MFILLQLANLGTYIVFIIEQLVFSVFGVVNDPHNIATDQCMYLDNEGEGTFSFYYKDSMVTCFLICFSMQFPIQQFVSCFYTVPLQYGFFDTIYAKQTEECIEDLENEKDEEIKRVLI